MEPFSPPFFPPCVFVAGLFVQTAVPAVLCLVTCQAPGGLSDLEEKHIPPTPPPLSFPHTCKLGVHLNQAIRPTSPGQA